MGDITAWNARTFNTLDRANQLFLPARELSRNDLSQDATAAAAKLAGGYMALPEGHAAQITNAYTALMGVSTGHQSPLEGHDLNRAPVAVHRAT